MELRWPNGSYVRLRIERSGFEPWPGTIFCCSRADILLSQCHSSPTVQMGTSEFNSGGNPGMD